MHRVLIVAPSWVGDAVMAQPLLQRLHERIGDLRLDALAPAWVRPALQRMPEISQVWINPFDHGQLRLRERWQLAQTLRAEAYDQAIVLPNSLKSALIPFFARIPLRTGFIGEGRYGLLNNARRLDTTELPLMVERFASLAEKRGHPLARPLPAPRLQAHPQERNRLLQSLGLTDTGHVVAFCPGAEYGPAKRWPTTHFAALARMLNQRGQTVWLFGSPKDTSIGEEIATAAGNSTHNLCGQTRLDEAIDLMAGVASVVSNDSGLMHIAAALQRPLVALYGSSSPGFTPPLAPQARVVSLGLECSPCFRRDCPKGHLQCLQALTPEQVLAELDAVSDRL